jgi:hypothetical protein
MPLVPAAGSLFGVYAAMTGTAVTYCPTGSGLGKRILAGNTPTIGTVGAPCYASSPAGFSGAGAIVTQAHFAASEAPLSVTEFNSYLAGHSNNQPTQFPAIAGAIAIAFNKAGVNTLTLSEGQICAVFSGQIATWDELGVGTGPIHIVYRDDESGTSFSFLNHLSAVCPQAANVLPGKVAATQFKTLQRFADPSGSLPAGAQAYLPSYVAPAHVRGNGEATDYIRANDGTLGYVEVAYAIAAPLRFASIRNTHSGVTVNPSTGFGTTALPVTLSCDKVLADSPDVNGRPVLVASMASSQCIAVVDPSNYADPATGYPILAVSYLLGNRFGNASDATAVRTLLGTPYRNWPGRTSVTRIGRIVTGYAWLSDPTTLDSADPTTGIQARINSCIN